MLKPSFEDLNNKVCVITGGAGVIGTALSEGMAAVGMKVVILDLDEKAALEKAGMLSEKFHIKAIGIGANVLDKSSLEDARKMINEQLGNIDCLINGAGGNTPKATTQKEEIEIEDLGDLAKTFYGLEIEGFDKVFDLNFKGTVLSTMVFSRNMLEEQKGAIVNISSMSSYKPLTKVPAYSAAKASVNNFTEWLAVHLAKTGIRVNAIAPGFFLTQQNHFLLVDEKTGDPTPRGKKIIASTPMGRYGEVEELQGLTLFLLSNMARFITGVVIPVDGGYSAFGGV